MSIYKEQYLLILYICGKKILFYTFLSVYCILKNSEGFLLILNLSAIQTLP